MPNGEKEKPPVQMSVDLIKRFISGSGEEDLRKQYVDDDYKHPMKDELVKQGISLQEAQKQAKEWINANREEFEKMVLTSREEPRSS